MSRAGGLGEALVQRGFAARMLEHLTSDDSAMLVASSGPVLLQVWPTSWGEHVSIVSGLRIDIPMRAGVARTVSEWNIQAPIGGFTMLGDDEVGLLMFHATFPHEVIYGSSSEGLQEYGWSVLRTVIDAPADFQAPDFRFSTATLGGRLLTESDAMTLLGAAG